VSHQPASTVTVRYVVCIIAPAGLT
jgi:hypothetical protein